jgi:hypothetical protein
MRVLLCVMLSVTLAAGGDAWGEAQASAAPAANVKKANKCTFPKSRKRAPEWVCTGRAEGLAVAAVGSAAKSKAGISFMEQMAAADARARLVREVRELVRKKMGGAPAAGKKADERDGASITITNDSLQGAKVEKKVYGPKGTLYVLVGLDAENAKQLVESITAEYLKQKPQ